VRSLPLSPLPTTHNPCVTRVPCCALAGAVATNVGVCQSALCSKFPMTTGRHYAELTILSGSQAWYLGLAADAFSPATSGWSTAHDSAAGWMLHGLQGCLVHAGLSLAWQGKPADGHAVTWRQVGLLLDLDQRSLTAWIDGSRCGVCLAPGWKDRAGQEVAAPLVGPLRWAVDVGDGASVRIVRKPPPPSPTTEELAAAREWFAQHGTGEEGGDSYSEDEGYTSAEYDEWLEWHGECGCHAVSPSCGAGGCFR